jgi:hypothetical protein
MNSPEFNNFLKQKQKICPATLGEKANEYATDKDRFHNFQVSSIIQNLVTRPSPERAAWNLASKQMASVVDIINSNDTYSSGYLDEKFGDLINYLYLIWGILENRYGHTSQYRPTELQERETNEE